MILSRLVGRRYTRSISRSLPRRRPSIESLEGRQLLATFTVTNINDSGTGSLRQAIISSNGVSGTATNTIDFAIGTGTQTIALKSALPTVVHAVTIDATTQPGTGTAPRIVLNGKNAGTGASGLTLDASNSGLKGVAVVNFSGGGVVVNGVSAVTISSDYIGAAPTGAAAGNAQEGIVLENGAHGDTVAGNFITANGDSGLLIEGSSTSNVIGGTTLAARNIISGNGARGVHITDSNNNVVEGNFIGTNTAGTAALGNGESGVLIDGGSTGNVVGGTSLAAQNIISGNVDRGVHITDSDNNVVEGNLIGMNANGAALGNGDSGVLIDGGSTGDVIGGTTLAARNIISGNVDRGVHITDSNNNEVEGNYIGTNTAGTAALGNGESGVLIDGGSTGNVIGGTTLAAQNIISGNVARGVHITDSDNNVVEGNLIGTNAGGTAALGNGDSGVLIDGGSTGNLIGGTTPGAGNVLSGNVVRGIHISDSDNNVVEGNLIGTNASGAALGNGKAVPQNAYSGVLIDSSSTGNVIGGTTLAARNIISGNGYAGVHISGSNNNVVEGNLIGTTVSGTPGLENVIAGVLIDGGAKGNVIGGTKAGASNTIENNLDGGVVVNGAGTGNLIEDNVIDANGFGQATAGLGDGVSLTGSPDTVVTGNTIDSNRDWGIYSKNSSGSALTGNTFAGNGLGTTHTA